MLYNIILALLGLQIKTNEEHYIRQKLHFQLTQFIQNVRYKLRCHMLFKFCSAFSKTYIC